MKEYGIARSTVSKWHNDYMNSGSFKSGDNTSDEEKELKELRKQTAAYGGRYFKTSGADSGTKRRVIAANSKKYSISAMCKGLGLLRSVYYYKETEKPLEVVVSDMTYVKCAERWHYICLLVDLDGRKIIGSAVVRQKDAKLVRSAFYGVKEDLRHIEIFHTDRGSEFKNQIIDEIIKEFGIKRSLSRAGRPIDNSCAESIYNIVKTEFAYGEEFADFDELELKWFDYVNWYNHVRVHGSLGYMTPNDYKRQALSPPEFI